MNHDVSLSLFILLFTLFQSWTVETSLSWTLCPFGISPSFFEQFDGFGTRYSGLILYFLCPSHGINNFYKKSQIFLVESGIWSPIYETYMYSLFSSSSHWTESWKCTCACAYLCVYPPYKESSGSDLTKCWFVPM